MCLSMCGSANIRGTLLLYTPYIISKLSTAHQAPHWNNVPPSAQRSQAAKTSHTSSQQQPASSVSPEDCGDCVGAANVGCKSRLQKSRSWQHPTTYPFSTPMPVVSRHHKGNPGGKRALLWKHLDRNSATWADPCFYLQFSVFGESDRC
jgi:hypothetical protein